MAATLTRMAKKSTNSHSADNSTATYKFALLIALSDLCIELGADDGDAFKISHHRTATEFIQLYWQQDVLIQNCGTQAAEITAFMKFRQDNQASTALSARLLPSYQALLMRDNQTVSAQPINYLQNLAGARSS